MSFRFFPVLSTLFSLWYLNKLTPCVVNRWTSSLCLWQACAQHCGHHIGVQPTSLLISTRLVVALVFLAIFLSCKHTEQDTFSTHFLDWQCHARWNMHCRAQYHCAISHLLTCIAWCGTINLLSNLPETPTRFCCCLVLHQTTFCISLCFQSWSHECPSNT